MTTETTTTTTPQGNAVEAGAQLAILQADAGWGQRLMAGDIEANKQFQDLTALIAGGDTIDDIVAGVVPEPGIGQANVHEMTVTAEALREAGISDNVIREVLTGRPVTPQEFRAVRDLQTRRHADREWCAKLLANNPDALRESWLMSIVLSSEIDDGSK